MGEMAVWSAWLPPLLPYRPPPQPLSVTYSSIHFGGSFDVWSSCLWSLISVWKQAIHNRNTVAALPLGVEVFCLQADIKNYPELPVLILVGNFLKFWWCRLSDTTCDRSVRGVSIIHAQVHLWGSTAELSKISRSVHLHFLDMTAGLPNSFRRPILTCAHVQMCNAETQMSFIQVNVSSFQQGRGFLLTGCRGRAGITKTRSSQCRSRNKREALGLRDICSAAWNHHQGKQKETVGKCRAWRPGRAGWVCRRHSGALSPPTRRGLAPRRPREEYTRFLMRNSVISLIREQLSEDNITICG